MASNDMQTMKALLFLEARLKKRPKRNPNTSRDLLAVLAEDLDAEVNSGG
jgi:hypothetical protein